MFKFASSRLSMSAINFYSHTPREIQLASEGYGEKFKQDVETQKIAVAFGIGTALKGKNINIFEEDEKGKKIDPKLKRKELDELMNEFN